MNDKNITSIGATLALDVPPTVKDPIGYLLELRKKLGADILEINAFDDNDEYCIYHHCDDSHIKRGEQGLSDTLVRLIDERVGAEIEREKQEAKMEKQRLDRIRAQYER